MDVTFVNPSQQPDAVAKMPVKALEGILVNFTASNIV
jgi:hypothetical protein